MKDVAVTATLVAGLLALTLLGGGAATAAGVAVLAAVAGPLVRPFVRRVWWSTVTVPVLCGLAAGVVGGVVGPADALGFALVYLAVQRTWGAASNHDLRVVLLLATLMLVYAGARTQALGFAAPVALWAVAGPAALVLTGSDRAVRLPGRWPVVSGAVVLVAVGVFLALPRLHRVQAASPVPVALTGFAPEVNLGDMEALLDDPTPVARLWVVGALEGPVYVRGVALDTFDGRRWTRSTPAVAAAFAPEPSDLRIRVAPDSGTDDLLLTVGEATAVVHPGVLRDGDGNFLTAPGTPVQPYVVYARAAPAPHPASAADRARWTALPALDPRIGPLAVAWTRGVDGAEARALAIRERLVAEYAYTRAPRDAGAEDPLPTFLFDRREGHCEYFASAEVVLLRALGVPARLVNGFVTSERSPVTRAWVVRRQHAHSWVEVLDGERWVVVDPTPGAGAPAVAAEVRWLEDARTAWTEGVVRYDLGVQSRWVLGIGVALQDLVVPGAVTGPPWLGWALLAGGCAGALGAGAWLAAAAWRRAARPRVPARRVDRVHARVRRRLYRAGWRIPSALPPVAAARWVRARAGDAAEPLEALAWLVYEVRYAGADDATAARRARDLARAVRLGPPARGPRRDPSTR